MRSVPVAQLGGVGISWAHTRKPVPCSRVFAIQSPNEVLDRL